MDISGYQECGYCEYEGARYY